MHMRDESLVFDTDGLLCLHCVSFQEGEVLHLEDSANRETFPNVDGWASAPKINTPTQVTNEYVHIVAIVRRNSLSRNGWFRY